MYVVCIYEKKGVVAYQEVKKIAENTEKKRERMAIAPQTKAWFIVSQSSNTVFL